MPRNLTAAVLCVLMTVLSFSSCGTQSQIETTWEMPAFAGKTFSKLGIIAIMKNNDESKAFELAAVNAFSETGAEAVPSFSFLPSDTLLNKDEMERRVEATGADGVLIFKLIAIDKTKSYVPPTQYAVPGAPNVDSWGDPFYGYYAPYPHSYWGYWYPAVQVVKTPGYWVTSSTYQVETALYRAADNKLVWMAMSGTYDPTSDYDLGSSLSATVVKKLQKAGLVPGKQP
jgi:hypothetical protein